MYIIHRDYKYLTKGLWFFYFYPVFLSGNYNEIEKIYDDLVVQMNEYYLSAPWGAFEDIYILLKEKEQIKCTQYSRYEKIKSWCTKKDIIKREYIINFPLYDIRLITANANISIFLSDNIDTAILIYKANISRLSSDDDKLCIIKYNNMEPQNHVEIIQEYIKHS